MSDDEAPDAPADKIMHLFERMNNELPARTNEAMTDMENLDKEISRRNGILQQQKIQYMANYDRMAPEQRTKGYENIKVREFQQFDFEFNINQFQAELQELLKLQDQKVDIAGGLKTKLDQYDADFDATEADFIENVKYMEVRESKKRKLTTDAELAELEKEMPIPKKRGRKKKQKEPSYCWCGLNNKDERDMIACDNGNCKIEWYHFSCVNITEPPPKHVTWFCGKSCEEEVRRNPELKVKDGKKGDVVVANVEQVEYDGEEEEEEGEEYQDPDGKSKKKGKKEKQTSRKTATKRKK